MKSLKLVLALVIVGGFAATCGAELVGTGIVKRVWIEEHEPRGINFSEKIVEPSRDSGYVVKVIWVEVEEPVDDEDIWDAMDGGFASDGDFWNQYKVDLPPHFYDVPTGDTLSAFDGDAMGTEFLVEPPKDVQLGQVELSTGSEVLRKGQALGGGQITVKGAAWIDIDKPELGSFAPTGTFPFAQVVVKPGQSIFTVSVDKKTEGIPLIVGPIQFYKSGVEVGTIVPEPSSMLLVMVVAGFVGLLAFWRRRRRA